MLAFALDNTAPATVILISGDRDFAYAVSVLRNRRYRLVLIAPATAHVSLKSQSSVVLDWNGDVLDNCVGDGLGFGSGSFPSNGEKDLKIPLRPTYIPPSVPTQLTQKPVRRPNDEFDTTAQIRKNSISRVAETKARTNPADVKPFSRESWTCLDGFVPPVLGSAAYKAAKASNCPSTSRMVTDSLSSFKPSLDTIGADTYPPQWPPANSGISRPDMTTSTSDWVPKPVRGDSSYIDECSELRPPFHKIPGSGPDSPLRKRSFTTPPSVSEIATRKRASHNGSTASSFSSIFSMPTIPISTNEAAASTTPSQSSHSGSFAGVPSLTRPKPPATSNDEQLISKSPANTLSESSELSKNTPLPPSPELSISRDESPVKLKQEDKAVNDDVPKTDFLPLVEQLARLRLAGNERPLRSVVGCALIEHNPFVYRQVGVPNFGAYTALAQKHGVIELGGLGGKAWILLKREVN